jgi:DNA-binding MarR family transcriptional regulator
MSTSRLARVGEIRWLNDDESRAWRGYLRMGVVLQAQLARELTSETGLSYPDYDVLSHLSETPGQRLRLKELGVRMKWTKSRLSHHATRMEQRGLVRREECELDGRGAWLTITDLGRRTIEAAAPSHVTSVRRHLIDRLSPEQLAALTDISDTIVGHLTTAETDQRDGA